jgi:hypothetical protein
VGGLSAARRRVGLAVTLAVVACAVLGYAAFKFTGQVSGHATLAVRKASASPQNVIVTPSLLPTPRATPSATVHPAAVPKAQTIVAVSAVAFGPQGKADGDNPQTAARVLSGSSQGWTSQWYATPEFGDLKQGTGLLLDMGRTVTITTVSLSLGSSPGAEVELRLGAAPDLGALPVVTTATATRDLLSLRPGTPVQARYVLVWFTRLPPDGAGTYQAIVHQVTVQGRP